MHCTCLPRKEGELSRSEDRVQSRCSGLGQRERVCCKGSDGTYRSQGFPSAGAIREQFVTWWKPRPNAETTAPPQPLVEKGDRCVPGQANVIMWARVWPYV